MELERFMDDRVVVKVGDITDEDADAIVNAANSSLLGGGGVDGAIHQRGGSRILDECREIRRTTHPEGLPAGDAVVTSGGHLKARYVIHTVGPVYGRNDGHDANLLFDCYKNSLQLATDLELISIAFPAISTGIYGYPLTEAARVASAAIKAFLEKTTTIYEVRLVFFSREAADTFLANHGF